LIYVVDTKFCGAQGFICMWYLNTVSLRNILHSLYFSFLNVTFPSTHQLLLMLRGTEFEVLTLVRTHNAIWVWKTNSLVHGYECSGWEF